MCGCEHHWDPSKSCTCACPEHVEISTRQRRAMLAREGVAYDRPIASHRRSATLLLASLLGAAGVGLLIFYVVENIR